jgi:hypothetical protein
VSTAGCCPQCGGYPPCPFRRADGSVGTCSDREEQEHDHDPPFVWAARRRKARAIVRTIDAHYAAACAMWGARWSPELLLRRIESREQAWWDAIAMLAGVKPPSAKTKDLVLEVYRWRST